MLPKDGSGDVLICQDLVLGGIGVVMGRDLHPSFSIDKKNNSINTLNPGDHASHKQSVNINHVLNHHKQGKCKFSR